ncbi:hypothetical protein BN1708_020139, partial [Verticillium longisporum]
PNSPRHARTSRGEPRPGRRATPEDAGRRPHRSRVRRRGPRPLRHRRHAQALRQGHARLYPGLPAERRRHC